MEGQDPQETQSRGNREEQERLGKAETPPPTYDRLVGLLIEGIKEQQEQINELKLQIKEIKNGSSS